MGVSTDAILAYGFDLGDPQNWDEYPDWYDDENDDDSFAEQAMDYLLKESGFTERDWQVEGYWGRKDEAEKNLGVEIIYYCSYDYPMFILGANKVSISVSRGDVAVIDPIDLAVDSEVDEKLRWALGKLEVLTASDEPSWLLVSMWG